MYMYVQTLWMADHNYLYKSMIEKIQILIYPSSSLQLLNHRLPFRCCPCDWGSCGGGVGDGFGRCRRRIIYSCILWPGSGPSRLIMSRPLSTRGVPCRSVKFRPFLAHPVSSRPVPFFPVPSHSAPFRPILPRPVPSCIVSSHRVSSRPFLSRFVFIFPKFVLKRYYMCVVYNACFIKWG